jgi:hypothetical protein
VSNIHIAGFNEILTDGGVIVDPAETGNFAVLPRVVEYPDAGLSTRETLRRNADGQVVTIQTTCVGETLEQAGWMLDRVRELVEGQRPVVPGWICSPIEQLLAQTARRDDDTDPAVFYAVASWRFTAVPVTPA